MQLRIFIQYILLVFLFTNTINSQDYFLENNGPYDTSINSPEEFLGYEIGFQHTRHDLIVAYLNYLSNTSARAKLVTYGKTHEGRKLVLLCISSEDNMNDIESIRGKHLKIY